MLTGEGWGQLLSSHWSIPLAYTHACIRVTLSHHTADLSQKLQRTFFQCQKCELGRHVRVIFDAVTPIEAKQTTVCLTNSSNWVTFCFCKMSTELQIRSRAHNYCSSFTWNVLLPTRRNVGSATGVTPEGVRFEIKEIESIKQRLLLSM